MSKIEKGDRVLIQSAGYDGRLNGEIGVVEGTHWISENKGLVYSVTVAGIPNPRSSRGVYWFGERELKKVKIEQEENKKMLEGYVPVGIKFIEGGNSDREYMYALYDLELRIGDHVVVKTKHHGFAVAVISNVYLPEDVNEELLFGREIVGKVDFSAFMERRDREKRVEELKQKMSARASKLQEISLYEILASRDSEMASALAEYKKLSGIECGAES